MKRINKFVDSIYKSVQGDKIEINEMKEEMKTHLIESVEELKAEGKTKDEAILLAINKFGEEKK